MIITYQGHDYSFDLRAIGVDEYRQLKRKYAMTPKQFGDGLDEADPDAMTFLFWVLLRQNGTDRGLTLGDHLKPDLIELNNAVAAAQAAEREAELEAQATEPEPEPGPTSPEPSRALSPPSLVTPGPAPSQTPDGQPREVMSTGS